MTVPEIYTHKGWFFLCPVYIGNPGGDAPNVDCRYAWLEWWFDVNLWFFGVCAMCVELVYPEFEPMFPFRITGKISR